MALYYWFAATYGWPPQVVDEMELDQVSWFPLMKRAHGDASDLYHSQHD